MPIRAWGAMWSGVHTSIRTCRQELCRRRARSST